MKKIVIERPKQELKTPRPDQVRGWLNQRTGRYFRSYCSELMEDLKDNWASGLYTGENAEETIQLNSEAIGKVQQIAELLLDLEELSTDERNTESIED